MTDVEEVLLAATKRGEALANADAHALRSLMHPDLRWTTFRGAVLDRNSYIDGNTGDGLRWHSQRLVDPHVVVIGDTAVLTAVVVDEVESDQGHETFRLRLTQTWVRQRPLGLPLGSRGTSSGRQEVGVAPVPPELPQPALPTAARFSELSTGTGSGSATCPSCLDAQVARVQRSLHGFQRGG